MNCKTVDLSTCVNLVKEYFCKNDTTIVSAFLLDHSVFRLGCPLPTTYSGVFNITSLTSLAISLLRKVSEPKQPHFFDDLYVFEPLANQNQFVLFWS